MTQTTPPSRAKYIKEKTTTIRIHRKLREQLAQLKAVTGYEPSEVILAGIEALRRDK